MHKALIVIMSVLSIKTLYGMKDDDKQSTQSPFISYANALIQNAKNNDESDAKLSFMHAVVVGGLSITCERETGDSSTSALCWSSYIKNTSHLSMNDVVYQCPAERMADYLNDVNNYAGYCITKNKRGYKYFLALEFQHFVASKDIPQTLEELTKAKNIINSFLSIKGSEISLQKKRLQKDYELLDEFTRRQRCNEHFNRLIPVINKERAAFIQAVQGNNVYQVHRVLRNNAFRFPEALSTLSVIERGS